MEAEISFKCNLPQLDDFIKGNSIMQSLQSIEQKRNFVMMCCAPALATGYGKWLVGRIVEYVLRQDAVTMINGDEKTFCRTGRRKFKKIEHVLRKFRLVSNDMEYEALLADGSIKELFISDLYDIDIFED